MMSTTQSEALLLSLLGPRPVFWYEERADSIFCAWNGIKMLQEHALMLVSEYFWKKYPSPEMKTVAGRKFHLLYRSGFFENCGDWKKIDRNRDSDPTSIYKWYKNSLHEHITKNFSDLDPATAYQWLSLDRYANPA